MLAAAISLALPAGADADIVVADADAFSGRSGGLIRVNPLTGARTTLSANASPSGGPAFVDPQGVVREASGALLVVDPGAFAGAGGGIFRVDPATGARTTVSENSSPTGGPSFVDPFGIALEANGNILVTDQNAFGGGGGVFRVDPATGARTAVSSNQGPGTGPLFDAPWGVAVAANGDILVADPGASSGAGAVFRVNPANGDRTVLSDNSSPSGQPSFDDPLGLTLAANGDILVVDGNNFNGTGSVIRVNPTTGARTLVSANGSPGGVPTFETPVLLALEADGDILVTGFTANNPGGGVTRVDPATGARATVSENSSPAGAPDFVFPIGILVEPAVAGTGPETTITGGPSGDTRERTPAFTFTSSVPGSLFACLVDGVQQGLCGSPFMTARLDPGPHSFEVAAIDPAGNTDQTPARRDFRVLAELSDLPRPVVGRTTNIEPVSGKVLIALAPGGSAAGRGRASQKGLEFVPLEEARQIPMGSFLDTTGGRVRVQTATGSGSKTQAGEFFKGLFRVLQSRSGRRRGLTELRLKGSSFRRCRARGSTGGRAVAARRRLSKRTVRRLRASAGGRFRTRGRHSAATVRGTVWTTADRCDGTLTRVKRGRVAVRDFRRRRTVVVGAGKRYLAPARP